MPACDCLLTPAFLCAYQCLCKPVLVPACMCLSCLTVPAYLFQPYLPLPALSACVCLPTCDCLPACACLLFACLCSRAYACLSTCACRPAPFCQRLPAFLWLRLPAPDFQPVGASFPVPAYLLVNACASLCLPDLTAYLAMHDWPTACACLHVPDCLSLRSCASYCLPDCSCLPA
jgi:hypothetical protein